MICAGLIIMVLCAVVAVYKYQNKQKHVPQSFTKQETMDSTPPPIIARSMQPSVFIEFDNSGGAYELIDDKNILDLGHKKNHTIMIQLYTDTIPLHETKMY